MGYEVDFLPVGEEQSGDAIALRFGNLFGDRTQQTVVVIDGGFADDGKKVVDHVRKYYGTNQVDLVVSTHADGDHSGGIETIITECSVGALWMHQPWNHTEDIAKMFKDGRVTDNSVSEALRKSLDNARSLDRLAQARGIPIIEPFSGVSDPTRTLWVVGPSQPYYESLLPRFRCTPEPVQKVGILEKALRGAEQIIKRIAERWDIETLDDTGETTAENNSSAILVLMAGDDALLFTSDAGAPALTEVADRLDTIGFDYSKIKFIQVPHHGSQRNVSPTILDRLLGPKLQAEANLRTAFVSVAKCEDPKHPSKKVMNAFRRRGAPVHATGGSSKLHFSDAPNRGWGPSVALPFYNQVEE